MTQLILPRTFAAPIPPRGLLIGGTVLQRRARGS